MPNYITVFPTLRTYDANARRFALVKYRDEPITIEDYALCITTGKCREIHAAIAHATGTTTPPVLNTLRHHFSDYDAVWRQHPDTLYKTIHSQANIGTSNAFLTCIYRHHQKLQQRLKVFTADYEGKARLVEKKNREVIELRKQLDELRFGANATAISLRESELQQSINALQAENERLLEENGKLERSNRSYKGHATINRRVNTILREVFGLGSRDLNRLAKLEGDVRKDALQAARQQILEYQIKALGPETALQIIDALRVPS